MRLSIILILVFSISAFAQPKLKADEIVQKHLASVGTTDALTAVKSIVVVGKSKADFKGFPTPNLAGVAQLGSESDKVLFAMIFNEARYPSEKAGYDGRDFSISRLPTGERSPLGDFLVSHSVIFKEGLIAGTLSSAWSLRNLNIRKAKLDYAGIEKLNNRPAYKIKYSPRREEEGMRIFLFFDAETFQHIRSEYQFTRSAKMGTSPTLAIRQSDTFYKLVEDFSDFRKEGNLVLPHNYKLIYTAVTMEDSKWLEWSINFSTFAFNQTINVEAYKVSTK